MTEASASAGLVSSLISFAVTQGAKRDDLLRGARISPNDLADSDTRIPLQKYQDLIRTAQKSPAGPAVALTWGAQVDMSEYSVVGLIMHASRTMGEAFGQLQRYGRLALELSAGPSHPRLVLEQHDGALWIVDKREAPNKFPEMSETAFARLACGPRRFLERPHVLEVHFTHAEPTYADEYRHIFQCPVRFSSHWNALKLHPETASWPVQQEPGYVFGILTKHADGLLETIERSTSVRGKVENVLLPILHKGDFTAETVAAALGFSRQSLYRKLNEEGTSFRDVVDELRATLAMEYLKGKRTSVNETAYLLGFSDPASFSRAFKRWTGKSPKEILA